MRNQVSALITMGACCALVAASPVRAQFDHLVAKVPAAANAIVLLNVDKVMASPPAVREDWKTQHNKSYAAGLSFLPPDAKLAVLSSHFNLDSMTPAWSVAVMELDHQPSLPTIERLTGGKTEQVGKYSAVALEGGAYVVHFGGQLLAAMAPATRQNVSRWVQEVDSTPIHRLSPYLAEAYGFADQIGTPIILALDLQDVADASTIREALLASEKYAKAEAKKIDELSTLLASIRGVTLGITLQTDRPFGKVKVDFARDVTISADEGKAILLHALGERGAMLDELEEWKPGVSARMITLEGYLTASGIKRLSSLFDRPPAFKRNVEVATPETTPAEQQNSTIAQNSKEYFHRVTDLFDDLKREKRSSSNYTMGLIAKWMDTYARKIDQLSVVGVDPELAAYGAFASDSLRSAASAIQTSNARKRVRQVNTPMTYDNYTYGRVYGAGRNWWGGITPYGGYSTISVPDYRAYQQARTAISAEERVTGANQAREAIDNLEKVTGDIRRKMSMKYNIPF